MSERTAASGMTQIPAEILAALLLEARAARAPAEAAARLREIGVDAASAYSALLQERLGDDPGEASADRFWTELDGLSRQLGFGSIENEPVHAGVLALSSPDWFEAIEGAAEHPCCHFSTGLLAELVRQVAGSELAAMEVECRSTGARRCRFLLGSPATVESVYEEMSRGSGYRDALALLT